MLYALKESATANKPMLNSKLAYKVWPLFFLGGYINIKFMK